MKGCFFRDEKPSVPLPAIEDGDAHAGTGIWPAQPVIHVLRWNVIPAAEGTKAQVVTLLPAAASQ